jgi:hypothetical protein
MCSRETVTNNTNTEQPTVEPVDMGSDQSKKSTDQMSYDCHNPYDIDDEDEFDRLIRKFEKEERSKYFFDDRPLDRRYDLYERRIVDEVVKAECGFIYEYSVYEYRDAEIDRRFRIFVDRNSQAK